MERRDDWKVFKRLKFCVALHAQHVLHWPRVILTAEHTDCDHTVAAKLDIRYWIIISFHVLQMISEERSNAISKQALGFPVGVIDPLAQETPGDAGQKDQQWISTVSYSYTYAWLVFTFNTDEERRVPSESIWGL